MSVFSVSYSEYSFAVFGDTKELKEELKALGGKFNGRLKHEDGRRPGWIVSKKQGDQLEKLIKKGPQKGISVGEEKQSTKEKTEEKSEEKPNKEGEKASKSFFIAQYTTKSIAVFGDTQDIKDKLKELGGRYNRSLTYNGKKQSGWIFRVEQKESVEKFLNVKCLEQEEPPQNEKKETMKEKETREVKKAEPKKKEEEGEKQSEKPPGPAPLLVDYSAKSVAVIGDSRELKAQLKALGGRYNKALTHEGVRQPGWIFRSESKDSVAKLLKTTTTTTCKRKREDEVAPPAKKIRKTEEEESKEESK